MPPRRKQPARRASLRAPRYTPTPTPTPTPSPPEPAIEAMDNDASGEDMDVSDDAPLDNDEVSSEPAGGLEDEASGSENNQDDDIEVEDIGQDAIAEEEEEEEEDELSESPPTPPPKPMKAKASPQKPRLKIKLKLSGVPQNTTPTPSDEMPLRPGRKGHPKHADVESEEEEEESSSSSTPYTGPTRMTQRQAALAGMVDNAEHLVLEETVSKRKKFLNETELALKREETARKRKNLTAKKLEDEKIETINRLLKKQTRTRGGKKGGAAEADEDGEPEGEESSTPAAPPPPPTLFRWVSSSKPGSPALSFSVPPSYLPDLNTQSNLVARPPPIRSTPLCDVSGCSLPRKYKLSKDPTRGGCGMEHLKALQVS